MMKNHKTYFKPWDTIHESNPQEILERHETITFVPFLIMQGALDDNMPPSVQEKFARPTRLPAATSSTSVRRMRATNGSPRLDRRPTARATW